MKTCSIDGCEKPLCSVDYCKMHYNRWQRHGDPLKVLRIYGDDEARFWSKTDKNGPVPEHAPRLGPCWVWTGWRGPRGYGSVRVKGRTVEAHRWAYTMLVGPVPDGLELDHLCRNPSCVRPSHLEPVTHQENILRGNSPAAGHARTTRCPEGHPYDEANTYVSKDGHRSCRACNRNRNRERYHARRREAEGV